MAFSFLCSLLFFLSFLSPILSFKQTYIVHMNENQKPLTYATRAHWYTAHLRSLSIDASSILYSYDSVFSGFAVSLSPSDAHSLRRSTSVLRMYNDTLYELHTTRSPAFLGLDAGPPGAGGRARTEVAAANVIIGVLDSGVWPESPSFSDAGMAEIPARWRGTCEKGDDFQPSNCNRKLIGARSFWKGYENAVGRKPSPASARDRDGHGTHTSSTAAGSRVANASFLGYAAGLARGMAPLARLAMYKVCWSRLGCFSADILAGFDAAISDGVDLLSLSMGSSGATPIYRDAIAIGAISAVDRGIFVACSAGNSGPASGTVANVAPWIATVGAGSIDRDFPAYVSLGNGLKYAGVSLYSGKGMGVKSVPLLYSNVSRDMEDSGNQCLPGALDSKLARGKVVLCESGGNSRVEKGLVVEKAGGVGMIVVARGGREKEGESHLLPAVLVGQKIGDQIRSYVRSNQNPTAVISFGGTVLDVKPSPVVAGFSSRGPNELTSQILKPDLIGPGLNILAAWSELIGPTRLDEDTRVTKFNIISGTSMSCPHISGVAALLKATHPDWSPSAIKSALMTTAYTVDNTKSPLLDAGTGARSTPFAHGSGHINPTKALSPGLVYELTTSDYIDYICSLGYDDDDVRTIVRHANVTCPRSSRDPGTLNYPSFSVLFGRRSQKPVKYERVLTNVGPAGSVYTVTVGRTSSVSVTVRPAKLVFKQVGQKLKYYVTFTSKARNLSEAFGWIAWSNKQHQVRSPVAYMWQ